MATEKRIGRQTPTTSVVLPYSKTYGQEAIDIYERSGRTAQDWQKIMLYDILSYNDDNLWVHTKFGYSVPRRNGKNEILAIRELYGLLNGERIMHTAHRTPTSHSAWERLCDLLAKTDLKEGEDYKTLKQFGLEQIEMLNGAEGKINFRTRSSKGGLGEGYDLLIIDEAQEYQEDQESALKYVVSDSPNPQTLFCGTPPTVVSSGTVFTHLRNNTLSGNTRNTGWAEWSVEHKSNINDVNLWYKTNPSMGTILTERKVADEIGTDELDFNIQRLGLWVKYNQKSAISRNEWLSLKVDKIEPSDLSGKVFVGIKYAPNSGRVAMSVATKTKDKRVFIESIGCKSVRNGNAWIIDFLSKINYSKVIIDGASGQNLLAEQLKKSGLKNIILPTVKEFILANATFEQAIYQKQLCHNNQPSLTQVATNCEKRAIGSAGGFGYKSIIDENEIALLDSVILAFWQCAEAKEVRKQRFSY